jgi:hypothetical protein
MILVKICLLILPTYQGDTIESTTYGLNILKPEINKEEK